LLVFSLLAGSGLAVANDLSDFNAAVEKAESHNRVAIGYLRTGNVDLASVELDRLRQAFEQVTARKRPAVFDSKLYVKAMTDVAMRLITADMMLKSGRSDPARQSLEAIRGDLYDLRKSAGVAVLADCVRDANTAMDALMVYNDRALDWTKADTRDAVASKASSYGAVLERCDGMADDAVRKAGEFRRLIDGARASLTLIPKAIATHDSDLLHRVLIELRSFDNLLAFRYG
ncbi:MAG: hypothetical protein P4M15_10755, partial [Alphaproteobacteria bacterium]|nr:hypothetical protein [Alphaproteobacteria bacterium]